MLRLAAFISLSLSSGIVAECIPPPVVLPVGNVSTYPQGLNRGAMLGIGSPPQAMAFQVHLGYNNTYVWSKGASCGKDTTSAACTAQHGGHYDSSTSSSAKDRSSVDAAKAAPNDVLNVHNTSLYTWTDDTFALNSNVSVPEMPFARHSDSYLDANAGLPSPQAILGLGANSSLLNALKASKVVGSSVFSYYWGLTGQNAVNQANGSLVLGGFDAAKVAGQPSYNVSIPSSPDRCPQGIPVVSIQQLNVVAPNGDKRNIIGSAQSSALTACLDPSVTTQLAIPFDPVFINFMSATNMWTSPDSRTFGRDFYNALIVNTSTTIFGGSLEVVLDNGLAVTIPNDQLIQPQWEINDQGQLFENTTFPTLLLTSLQDVNRNDPSQLGRSFFSEMYMMVNQKKSQATLWPAVRTSNTQFMAVDDDGNIQSSTCMSGAALSSPSGSSSSSSSSSSQSNATSNPSSGTITGGTVAGAVIGALAGVAAIAAAVFFLIRRNRMSKAAANGAGVAVVGGPWTNQTKYPGQQGPSELTGYGKQPVSEVSGEYMRVPISELPGERHTDSGPHEMPAERY